VGFMGHEPNNPDQTLSRGQSLAVVRQRVILATRAALHVRNGMQVPSRAFSLSTANLNTHHGPETQSP